MTAKDYPTDWMGNPNGRDYHYRFHANDQEAWKRLRFASWKNRYFEMYPKDMKHLRTKIDHVTVKTYDHKGHIKGMKKYAKSPNWQKVPFSHGKKEMKNAPRGGTKIKAEVYTGERYGTVSVDYAVDYTPTEIIEAFENGVNENAVARSIDEAQHWAVEERIDEIREEEMRHRSRMLMECDHPEGCLFRSIEAPGFVYCDKCRAEYDAEELKSAGVSVPE